MMAEDGELLDSWEEQVDSGVLDERFKKIAVSSPVEDRSPSSTTPPILMREETGRTEYRPQVRILKRDPNPASADTPGNSLRATKVNKPMKTLEQREAEYAEARLRIFGAAVSEADLNSSNNSSDSSPGTVINSQMKGAKVDVTKTTNNVAVLRQPKGPDGSKGFTSAR